MLAALRAIPCDTVLVCWCAQHACHAEVAEAALRLRERDQEAAEVDREAAGSEEPADEG